MDRTYESGAAGSPPSAPASPSSGYPTAGNPQTATPSTKPGPWWYYQITEELWNVINAAGHVHSHTDVNQLNLAIQALIQNALASVVTAPQFDNDTSLATTAFVQRALGNVSTVDFYTASASLTASQAGRLFDFYGASAATLTLPASNTVLSGGAFSFTNLGSGDLTVARSGADTITTKGGSQTSVVVRPGESLTLVGIGSAVWLAVDGSALLQYAVSFGASLSVNGYQKSPSGFIEQWGTSTVNANSTLVVTLPTTFLSAFYGALCTSVDSNTSSSYRVSNAGGTTSSITLVNQSASAQVINYRCWGK